jgi:hypothetical protein
VCKLNSIVDPELESAWFQTLNLLKCDILDSTKFALKFQLVPLRRGVANDVRLGQQRKRGKARQGGASVAGAVPVESSLAHILKPPSFSP